MQWIMENWVALGVAVLAVLRAAELVAAMTPTDKDDKIIAKISSVVAKLFSQAK